MKTLCYIISKQCKVPLVGATLGVITLACALETRLAPTPTSTATAPASITTPQATPSVEVPPGTVTTTPNVPQENWSLVVVRPSDLPTDSSCSFVGSADGIAVFQDVTPERADWLEERLVDAFGVTYEGPSCIYYNELYVWRDDTLAAMWFAILAETTTTSTTLTPIEIPALGTQSEAVSGSIAGDSGGLYAATIFWRYDKAVVSLRFMGTETSSSEVAVALAQLVQARLEQAMVHDH